MADVLTVTRKALGKNTGMQDYGLYKDDGTFMDWAQKNMPELVSYFPSPKPIESKQ